MTYRTYSGIDYIAASNTLNNQVHLFDDIIRVEEKAPLRNYNRTIYYNSGAIQMYSTTDTRVGTHIQISGEPLGVLRGEGFTDLDILNRVMEYGFKLSRIDIQVTSENVAKENDTEYRIYHSLNPGTILKLCNQDELVSRLKPDNPVVDRQKQVETCYIGSRSSRNRIFRAYDKGLELGMAANQIIRYELETRKNPQGIARAIMIGESIPSIIRRFVDFPKNDTWIELMSDNVATMPQIDTNLTAWEKEEIENAQRWQWLIETAAKTLNKALNFDRNKYIADMDNENLRMFLDAAIHGKKSMT